MNPNNPTRLKAIPAVIPRSGVLRQARLWVVQHPGWAALLTLLLLAALGGAQAWVTHARYVEWSGAHPAPEKLSREQERWLLIWSGAVTAWYVLYRIFVSQPRGGLAKRLLARVNFDAAVRRRLGEGQPIRRGFLTAHGILGAVGFALSTGLMLQLVENYTWLRSLALFHDKTDFFVPLLTLLMLWTSAGQVRSVWVQAELIIPPGEIAEYFADAVLEAEEAEAETEREEKRKDVAGWPAVILIVGGLGGVALSQRLPEAGQIVALMGLLIGLESGLVTMYLAKTRPSGWWLWQGLALLAAAAGVIYLEQSFASAEWCLLAGLLWGAVTGVVMVVVYLKAVARRERQLID